MLAKVGSGREFGGGGVGCGGGDGVTRATFSNYFKKWIE